MAKSNLLLGRKGFIPYYNLQSLRAGTQNRHPETETETEAVEESAYWLALLPPAHGVLSFLHYQRHSSHQENAPQPCPCVSWMETVL